MIVTVERTGEDVKLTVASEVAPLLCLTLTPAQWGQARGLMDMAYDTPEFWFKINLPKGTL